MYEVKYNVPAFCCAGGTYTFISFFEPFNFSICASNLSSLLLWVFPSSLSVNINKLFSFYLIQSQVFSSNMGLKGHMNIKVSTLTICQEGSYFHSNKSCHRIMKS